MMAGYPTMNNAAADMSNLFLMANGNAGGTNGAGNSNVDGMNHMNLFNYNMQAAAAAAYGNQLYGANFNPALVQNMMGGGGGGGYPAQAVMQAQMAAGNGSNNTQGFPYSTVATTTNATSTSSATTATSAADPNLFFSDNDTVRNVMDDFMSSSE
ncbi:hypothetical protein DYB37_000887 [Aphanomyces astaci]|uniref:Uncharacterized protein n=1 Tax=Aphanomyces astaci TaxID=112090 RepID=A0A3L6VHY7_APHAT|nr:hypothetical protein DYB35_000601 [Aphanomyces astaci]RHZ04893.1 hypothetical protein DYB37_000887 [Aphanomyces astaci]RLO08541.1 hypothetical protein DYB28_012384 [Aphanomyces astaci]